MPDEPQDTDWAYAAGFVDGEGCIAVTREFRAARETYTYSIAVVVANNERDVLDWLKHMWTGWVVQVPRSDAGSRHSWAWRSPTGTRAEPFLAGIRPWLRIKSKQCDNALSMIEVLKLSRYTLGRKQLPLAWHKAQEQHYWRQRELNHRGTRQFAPVAMHSPRRIHRERLDDTKNVHYQHHQEPEPVAFGIPSRPL